MSVQRFALESDDAPEPFWLDGSVTVGRHLDNDLVVAGEDVLDFHLRLDLSPRGPRVTPIDGATVHVDGRGVEESTGIMPGEEIVLGQHRLRLVAAADDTRGRWALHDVGTERGVPIAPELTVGRAEDCALRIAEGHISRHHAVLRFDESGVWLKDLDSANGTFVNGERVRGACRLFHGDEVAFDIVRFQLIGDAPDLTPIRPVGGEPDQLAPGAPTQPRDSAESRAMAPTQQIEAVVAEAAPRDVGGSPPDLRGPALLGRTAPMEGRLVPLAFGRHTVGRDKDCDIVLNEGSVSAHHAEIEVKADGVYLVSLLSTNGTQVNGADVNTCRLEPGDEIQFGRVRMELLVPAARRRGAPTWLWVACGLALAGALVIFATLA